jgi:heme/copper-type cytochrome/quinol oxidase subunit 2
MKFINIDKDKIVTGSVILAVIAIIAAVYFYIQYSNIKTNPQQVSQQEAIDLVARVGKLILLPTDEVPTIATVTDPQPLKNQPFFANAQKGDRVLIYTGAKKAILYNPTENKIVEVAPVNIGNQNQAPTATSTKK